MNSWIESLNKAVAAALTDLKSGGSSAKELIQRIYEEPSNAFCADCNANGREELSGFIILKINREISAIVETKMSSLRDSVEVNEITCKVQISVY